MEAIDIWWLLSAVVLALVAWFRFRAGVQRIGSLIVVCFMIGSAIAILLGKEKLAQALEVIGIGTSGVLVILYERWKSRAK